MAASVPNYIRRLCAAGASAAARDRAAMELVRIGTEAVDTLCLCLSEPDAATRGLAAEALAMIGDERAVPFLLEAAGDDDWGVRQAVVAALGRFRNADVLDALCVALGDPVWSVAAEAVEALRPRRDVRSLQCLMRAARDGHAMLRQAALRVLKEFGPGAALAERVLVEARMTPDERRAAIEDMSRFRARQGSETLVFSLPSAQEFCRARLAHPDPAIAEGARRVLESGRLLRPSTGRAAGMLLRPVLGRPAAGTAELLRPADSPEEPNTPGADGSADE